MGIGIKMFVEVYPSWIGLPIGVCLTPGGLFLFHNRTMFQMLGLQLDRQDIPRPLFPCRGWPEGVSREIVNLTHVFVSENAPRQKALKKQLRHHSLDDEQAWIDWGLKVVEIRSLSNYAIEVPDGARCVFDPGCEKPSWLSAAELMEALQHSGYDIDNPNEDAAEAHNACVFRWVRDLSTVHGETNVRVVFWFDSVGQEFL